MQLLGLNDPVLSEVAPEGNNLELGNALNPLPDYEDSLFDDYSDSTSASDRFLSSEMYVSLLKQMKQKIMIFYIDVDVSTFAGREIADHASRTKCLCHRRMHRQLIARHVLV